MNGAYVSTLCNFAHRLSDGKPIRHECYVIPPRLLQAEASGDLFDSPAMMEEWRQWTLGPRETMRRGCREVGS